MLSVCVARHNKYDLPNFYSRSQVKDSSELSLADFCARAQTPLNRNLAGKSRGPADALRTVCWYRYLASKTQGISAYAFGKRVEPEGYKVDEINGRRIHSHSNKWIRYSQGRAVPQGALIATADMKYPGSAAVINHPVWLLIERQFLSLDQLNAVKSCFSPRVQIEIDAIKSLPPYKSPSFAIFEVKWIILMDPLDALGAIAYLLCLAKLRDDTYAQACWVTCAYRAMLIHGPELRLLGIALPMFELLKNNLLLAVKHNGEHWDYPTCHYLHAVELLVKFYENQSSKRLEGQRFFIHETVVARYGAASAIVTWPISVPAAECWSAANVKAYEYRLLSLSRALLALLREKPVLKPPTDDHFESFSFVFEEMTRVK